MKNLKDFGSFINEEYNVQYFENNDQEAVRELTKPEGFALVYDRFDDLFELVDADKPEEELTVRNTYLNVADNTLTYQKLGKIYTMELDHKTGYDQPRLFMIFNNHPDDKARCAFNVNDFTEDYNYAAIRDYALQCGTKRWFVLDKFGNIPEDEKGKLASMIMDRRQHKDAGVQEAYQPGYAYDTITVTFQESYMKHPVTRICGHMSKEQVIDVYGLNEPDIVWYQFEGEEKVVKEPED